MLYNENGADDGRTEAILLRDQAKLALKTAYDTLETPIYDQWKAEVQSVAQIAQLYSLAPTRAGLFYPARPELLMRRTAAVSRNTPA